MKQFAIYKADNLVNNYYWSTSIFKFKNFLPDDDYPVFINPINGLTTNNVTKIPYSCVCIARPLLSI